MEGRNSGKNIFSSISSKGSSSSTEIKNDIRTGPRPNLFPSAVVLQEERPQTRKSVLGSRLGEGGFFNSAAVINKTCECDDKHF